MVAMHPMAAAGVWRRFVMTLEMIRFEHSVFALPFALTGAALAWRTGGFPMEGMGAKLLWIVVAMVGARSAAMGFNRVLDAQIDARNPRTSGRHIPAGLLSQRFAWAFVAASAALLALAAAMLNPLCLALSPVALGVVFFYSWTKRFTALSHVVLGFALGIAPAAAWMAVAGQLDAPILWLTAAVTLWTAGFDIIYSCQDFEFDRREGLHSIPARLGVGKALVVARLLHVAMVACLVALAVSFEMGRLAWAGIAVTALMLAWEHRMVRADDMSKVNAAFFTMNGWVSVVFFVFWAADVMTGQGRN